MHNAELHQQQAGAAVAAAPALTPVLLPGDHRCRKLSCTSGRPTPAEVLQLLELRS